MDGRVNHRRSSALSESGEYWGEQDEGWSRGALTTEQQSAGESAQQETSRKKPKPETTRSRRREPIIWSRRLTGPLQPSQPLSHREGDILAIHKLKLKMKTPLAIMKPAAGGDGYDALKLKGGDRLEDIGPPDESIDACFGEISWTKKGEEESSRSFGRAKYACFHDDTDVSDVFKLLSECWKLKAPSVLFSVTGSAQELNLEPKLTKDFEKGLAEAVDCTDGWVVTGGTDTGVMALVGRALRKRQLAATVGDAG